MRDEGQTGAVLNEKHSTEVAVKPRKSRIKRFLRLAAVLVIAMIALPVVAKYWVVRSSSSRIYTSVHDVPKCRVAVVLGARVFRSGALCDTLARRVDKGIELYKAGKVDKLLMSGDNSVIRYNEPQHMFEYAVKHGVPAKDIAMDFAGRSTYDSMYRAKNIFGQNEFIVVSQDYHIKRAIFFCNSMGLKCYGVAAVKPYHPRDEAREYPACVAAVLNAYILHPVPIMGRKEKI